MASEIVVRPAAIEDAAAIRTMIAGLARETIGEHQTVMSVEAVERYGFGPEKAFDCFVAARGGEVVGAMVVFDEFSTWRGEKGVHILDIFIAREARGLGVGRRLVGAAAKWGRARGATYIRLAVDRENARAIEFYKATGFKDGAPDRLLLLRDEAFAAMLSD